MGTDTRFTKDGTRGECPFSGRALVRPENKEQAYCDQLHSDLRLLWGAANIKDSVPQRKKMLLETITMMVIHLNDLYKCIEKKEEKRS